MFKVGDKVIGIDALGFERQGTIKHLVTILGCVVIEHRDGYVNLFDAKRVRKMAIDLENK